MKKLLIIAICLIIQNLISAQKKDSLIVTTKKDTLWRKSFSGGVNFNQSSFSSNWKGGGVNSFAIAAFLNGRAYYEKGKSTWDNNIDLQYSRVNTSGVGNRKGTDRIFLDSKYGYGLGKTISIFASLNFLSQFDKGYNYAIIGGVNTQTLQSNFLAPGFLTESLGLDYKPTTWFDVRWGIASARQTIVTDTTIHQFVPSNYGVPLNQKVRNQIGSDIVATLNKDLAKNLNLKAIFSLFTDYAQPGVMVPRLDVSFTSRVVKYVNVNLAGTLFYDQTQDLKIQTSQVLSVGVLYSFSQFKK